MSNHLSQLIKHRVNRRKAKRSEVAAQLAPLEEQQPQQALERVQRGQPSTYSGAHQERGAIVVESDGHGLSNDIVETRYGRRVMGMEPVVLVILGVMLLFIAFIAWQISLMPAE